MNKAQIIPIERARKCPFLVTVTKSDGTALEHTVYAYNLKDATKFALDFIGEDYLSITVECT
jgi:hypothetical protein